MATTYLEVAKLPDIGVETDPLPAIEEVIVQAAEDGFVVHINKRKNRQGLADVQSKIRRLVKDQPCRMRGHHPEVHRISFGVYLEDAREGHLLSLGSRDGDRLQCFDAENVLNRCLRYSSVVWDRRRLFLASKTSIGRVDMRGLVVPIRPGADRNPRNLFAACSKELLKQGLGEEFCDD